MKMLWRCAASKGARAGAPGKHHAMMAPARCLVPARTMTYIASASYLTYH